VPPSGWQQETAFADVSTPNARDQASVEASRKLVLRLCSSAGGTGCDYLTAHARVWKTGSSGHNVCAMAVVKTEELAEWRGLASTLALLDERLAQASKELLQGLSAGKRVAIDQVVDRGVPGGERADWLRARHERFLARLASVVSVPKKWAGDGVPEGIDVVISGRLVSRIEQGVPTLEVIWTARFRDGRRLVSAPLMFPEQAAPRGPAEALPETVASPGLSLRIESARGGSLCAGERSQLWLKTDSPMFVRVLDLYGKGEALVTYPNDDQPSLLVPAGQPIPLGARLGFEAVPIPGYEAERYLVIAAPTEAALGRFAKAKGPCRLPADLAGPIFAGAGLPAGVRAATTGYRITSGGECPAAPPREGVTDALQALPMCSF
jgi:hypothetical protein